MRTRLYFTSESHIHGLLNVLRYSHLGGHARVFGTGGYHRLSDTRELDYLSHIVFRMWENTRLPLGHSERFRVEVSESRAICSPLHSWNS